MISAQIIPKKIHYCWFGGNPLPDLALKCIESWKKYCPDYEIVEWNETTFDLSSNRYVHEAAQAKKWAFVSDYVRLYALVNYGGIYMDTDVEVLKSLDEFLENEAFSGFEGETGVTACMLASKQNHPIFNEFLTDYDDISFFNEEGTYDLTTNVVRITNHCLKHGLTLNNQLQNIDGLTIYPKDYFCPLDPYDRELKLTKNSCVIHHFSGSWMDEVDKYQIVLRQRYRKIFGKKFGGYLARFNAIKKYKGFKVALKEFFKWMKK